MLDILYTDDEHKSYLEDKLKFYEVENLNLVHLNDASRDSILIVKTNFNLDKSIIDKCLPIDNDTIDKLVQKKFIKVVFFNETEPDNYDVIKHIREILRNLNINEDRLTVINNNEELINFKKDSKINVYVNHPHIYASAKEMIKVDYDFMFEKKYNFMSYNRNLKAHRFFFLCLLKKYNILENTDWSWLRGDEMSKFIRLPDWFYNKIMNEENLNDLKNEIEFLIKNGRKISEYEFNILENICTDNFDYPNHYKLNPYQNSYVHIVNESYYEDKDVILLSEKSIIPFYFSQIPIFLASQNHLKYLRERYEFDFFDDFINHDYDKEKNNYTRMIMLVNEIDRLNKNKKELINFYKNSKSRFEKNKKIINNIVNEFKDSKYIKSLIYE